MAHNVHGFRGGVGAVARVAAEARPDLAFLSEAGGRMRLGRFARRMGMEAVSGLRLVGGIPNAVLLRPPWRAATRRLLELPRSAGLARRGVMVVEARGPGRSFTAASVHLGLAEAERARHVRVLTDVLAGLDPPVLLGGDLNEGPGSPAASWLAHRLQDAFSAAGEGPGETFPAAEPRARIDFLFVSAGVTVERCWVGGPAFRSVSDHLPVFADVAVGGEGS